jgi:hypothetical protein
MRASELRQNIYRILDQVLESGESVVIERKGRRLRITPEVESGKLSRVQPDPDYIVGDPEDFVHLDWSDEWTGA